MKTFNHKAGYVVINRDIRVPLDFEYLFVANKVL